jgi:uncharacterized delta-60 repeat protein
MRTINTSTAWSRVLAGGVGRFLRVSAITGALALLAVPQVAQAAEGGLDPTFGSGGKEMISIGTQQRDFAQAVGIQSDGKIIVGGELGDYSADTNTSVLVRLNPNGSLDGSFGTGGKVVNQAQKHLRSLVIQPDGKIVTAAATTKISISMDFAAARYNPDGSLDQTFGNGGYAVNGAGNANAVLLQPDGKIILIGTLPVFREGSDFLVARFNPDGTADQGFGNGGRVQASFTGGLSSADAALAGALQADGKIVVSGYSSCISVAVVRYNPDGTIDDGFALNGVLLTPNFGAVANRVAIQTDGKIVIGGGGFVVGRFTPDGKIDRSFGANGRTTGGFGSGSGSLNAMLIDANGRIWAAGSVSYSGTGNAAFVLARYTRDGIPDPAFGNNGFVITEFTGALDEANALALQADGKPVLAGYAAEPGATYVDFAVARYLVATGRLIR